ncbi:MAG TPA: hypothetical protein VHB50_02725, partial [Bryobacteraceae bacterium]|nr:hypothetical protein [Bryobacteraceae bacterium]
MGASAGETRSSKAVGLGYGIDGPAQLHQRGRQFDAVFDAVYPFAYPYNSAGGLENETFPSGRYTQSCYDAAGRVKSISGAASANATSTNYAGQVSYAPQGAIQSMARGDGLTEAWTYNNRLQPTGISVGTTGSPRSAFGLDLYYCAGKALACAGNNGNIRTANLSAPGVDQNFTYDPLNRLLSAAEGTAWAEGFSYDQFGNRWVDTSQTSG